MDQELFELKLQGYCCSQIIMEMGLRRLHKENPDLVAAMRGLCNGAWQGKICGILSAAVCLFYLADPERAGSLSSDFSEWFLESYGHADCDDLLEGDPLAKVEKCPAMIDASFAWIADRMDWE